MSVEDPGFTDLTIGLWLGERVTGTLRDEAVRDTATNQSHAAFAPILFALRR